MPDAEAMTESFQRLAAIFAPYRHELVVTTDEPEHLSLDAPPSTAYAKGLFFGAVKIGKRYVSFHLMPVYVHPDLLDDISPELRRRMQGKSCFNFTTQDEVLFAELGRLTRSGIDAYRRDGTIPATIVGA